jgi:aryl-phospho-beta-D-glucosidase BglC (GH1 family)
MPNKGSTRDRLVWAIKEAIKNKMRVIIDYHGMGSEPWVRDPARFAKAWADLWKYIKARVPRAEQHVILDIFNEPDSMGLKWKDMAGLYLGVMDALPGPLPFFMIEGTGQTTWNMNWGDGFVTDPAIIKAQGIDDPRPFFDTLVKKPYVHRVIISPHIYGPSISKANKAYKGSGLYERLDKSFGYLKKTGYKGIKFNIILGEFGTKFEDVRDLELMLDLAQWMKDRNITVWVFWNYAENGADTLNLVTNNWQDINWKVVEWLRKEFDLGGAVSRLELTTPYNYASVINALAELLGLSFRIG